MSKEVSDAECFAHLDSIFKNCTAEEAKQHLRTYAAFEYSPASNWRDWWMNARELLLDKVRDAEAEARLEKAIRAKKDLLNEAKAAGKDVCWECKTIEPVRCSCGRCLAGCNTDYGGYCTYCDDDDDYDSQDPWQC